MQIFRESTASIEGLFLKRNELSAQLKSLIEPISASILVKGGESIDAYLGDRRTLILVEEGTFRFSCATTPLYLYEEGDVFIWTKGSHVAELACDFATQVRIVRLEDLFMLKGDNLSLHAKIFALVELDMMLRDTLLVELFGSSAALQPTLLHFQAGESILERGSCTDVIYTLAEGKAGAYDGDRRIGDITKNEIFGTVSALTKSPQHISVRADDRCLVVAVTPQQFLPFLLSRPKKILQVLQEMANAIVDLNKRVK